MPNVRAPCKNQKLSLPCPILNLQIAVRTGAWSCSRAVYCEIPMTPESFVSWGFVASIESPWSLTAGRARAGVARLQRLLVASLAEVVSAGVADDGPLAIVSISVLQNTVLGTYANDTLGANDLDELVGHRALGVALGIRLDVAEVTNMAVLIGRGTVGLAVGVDCAKAQRHVHNPKSIGRVEDDGATYSAGRPRCSRWCCHQRCGCACHAWRWHRGR